MRPPLNVDAVPTAQTSLEPAAEIALRIPFSGGLAATVQVVPFQCSIRVCSKACASVYSPTAHASDGPTAATPERKFPLSPGDGLGTTAHEAPSQCSISV